MRWNNNSVHFAVKQWKLKYNINGIWLCPHCKDTFETRNT